MDGEDFKGPVKNMTDICVNGEILTLEVTKLEDGNYLPDFEYSEPSQEPYEEEAWLAEELGKLVEETNDSNAVVKNDYDIKLEEEIKEHLDEQANLEEKQINFMKTKDETRGTTTSILFEDKELSLADMFICEICHRVFSSQYKLESHQYQKHKLVKSPKRNKPKCKKAKVPKNKDSWPPNVQDLACKVNGVKVFYCNLCSYSVNRCDSMNKHMLRVHSNGRAVPNYMCEVCGKTFIDKAYLRNHGVSHVTEKLYECDVCGRAFHRQPSLKRHLQSHTPDKQFACLICDYKTNRKHLMYKHVEHHETGRAFTCKVCSEQFYTQLSLRSHLYTHNLTPNACSFCKVGFSSRERMICHMKKIHFACEVLEMKAEPQ